MREGLLLFNSALQDQKRDYRPSAAAADEINWQLNQELVTKHESEIRTMFEYRWRIVSDDSIKIISNHLDYIILLLTIRMTKHHNYSIIWRSCSHCAEVAGDCRGVTGPHHRAS